jgi:hypothetical protein
MIDAAAALDQALVQVYPESYKHYLALLDQLPSGEVFERLGIMLSAPTLLGEAHELDLELDLFDSGHDSPDEWLRRRT